MNQIPLQPAQSETVRTLLANLWRFRLIVLVATVLCGLLGWGASRLQEERYEATAQIMLVNPRDAVLFREFGPSQTDSARYVRNQAERLRSSTVAQPAAELLGAPTTGRQVLERSRATASGQLDLVTVVASGPTAVEAADLANALLQAYEDVVRAEMRTRADDAIAELTATQAQLQSRMDAAEQRLQASPDDGLASLEREKALEQIVLNQQLIERISIDAALFGSGVQMVEPAQTPDEPVAPRPVRNGVAAGFVGFGLVAGATIWRGDALRRIDRRHEAAEVLGVPLLGSLPEMPDLDDNKVRQSLTTPESPIGEAFRFAAAAIEPMLDAGVRTIVLTSALRGDGKTTSAISLGAALRRDDRPVIVIDADVRTARLSRLVGRQASTGLTDLSRNPALLDNDDRWPPRLGRTIRVLPVGRHRVEPTQFFRTTRYRAAMTRLVQSGYLLVVDAPPLLAVADASAIAGSADAIVLVVSRGTPVRVLADLKERLEFVGTPVLGYIFNKAAERRGMGYGYGYGYALDRQGSQAHDGRPPPAATRSAGRFELLPSEKTQRPVEEPPVTGRAESRPPE